MSNLRSMEFHSISLVDAFRYAASWLEKQPTSVRLHDFDGCSVHQDDDAIFWIKLFYYEE